MIGEATVVSKVNDLVTEVLFPQESTATTILEIKTIKILNSMIKTTAWSSDIIDKVSNVQPEVNSNLTEMEVEKMIGFILKQLSEKLDAVRVVAGNVLHVLLKDTDDNIIKIPHRSMLYECFIGSDDDEVCAWARPHAVFPRVVRVMELSEIYFPLILEGIVISIGGMTEEIFKESSKAFLAWLNQLNTSKSYDKIESIALSLLNIAEKFVGNTRVTLPLMKTLDLIYKKGALGDRLDKTGDIEYGFMKIIKQEMNQCSDVLKLIACINVIIHLLSRYGRVRKYAMRSLIMLLGHKYPRIRKYTAEQLYLHFISDTNIIGEPLDNDIDPEANIKCPFVICDEDLTIISDLLTDTPWSTNIQSCRSCRSKICSMTNIDLKIKTKETSNKKNQIDELDSYGALVRDAGY